MKEFSYIKNIFIILILSSSYQYGANFFYVCYSDKDTIIGENIDIIKYNECQHSITKCDSIGKEKFGEYTHISDSFKALERCKNLGHSLNDEITKIQNKNNHLDGNMNFNLKYKMLLDENGYTHGVRDKPSINSSIISHYSVSDIIIIKQQQGNWVLTEKGWLQNKELQIASEFDINLASPEAIFLEIITVLSIFSFIWILLTGRVPDGRTKTGYKPISLRSFFSGITIAIFIYFFFFGIYYMINNLFSLNWYLGDDKFLEAAIGGFFIGIVKLFGSVILLFE